MFHVEHFATLRIGGMKVRAASFCNWRSVPRGTLLVCCLIMRLYLTIFHLHPTFEKGFVGNITGQRVSGLVVPLYSGIPIDNTLVCDFGTGIGGHHFIVVTGVRRGSWAAPISRARVPLRARRVTAWGRMASKCSTARRVTTSARGKSGRAARTSARSVITLMLVNVSARATSRRKVAFLLFDS